MPLQRADLGGQRFGRLVVESFSHVDAHRRAHWNCLCDCGIRCVRRADLLKAGRRVSCGCANEQTKIAKGQRLSKATEFKPGVVANNHLPVGSERLRTGAQGVVRAWVKIAEPKVWRQRAVVVWESVNGPLPKGKLIHHKDRNPLNDSIDNLQCMTRKEHVDEHRLEYRAIRSANTRRRRCSQVSV